MAAAMAMEVLVDDHAGMPENSVVSIRFGATRRQAPLDTVCRHPLKFPASVEACCEPLKIDVLQPVASARIVLHPNEARYRIGLDTKGRAAMAVGLKIQNFPGAAAPQRAAEPGEARAGGSGAGSAPLRYQDAASSAREYLELHGLLRYVQALLHAVIQVRPKDPYQFIMMQLGAAQSMSAPNTSAKDARPAADLPAAKAAPPQTANAEDDELAQIISPTTAARTADEEPVREEPKSPMPLRPGNPMASAFDALEGAEVGPRPGKRLQTAPAGAICQDPRGEVPPDAAASPPRDLVGGDAAGTQAKLKVKIVGATGLQDADWAGKSDPYCVCRMPRKPDFSFQTKVVSGSLRPEWNEEFVEEFISGDTLEFAIFDSDACKTDELLGRVTLKSEVFLQNGFQGALPLSEAGGKGAVNVIIEAMDAVPEQSVPLSFSMNLDFNKLNASPERCERVQAAIRSEVVRGVPHLAEEHVSLSLRRGSVIVDCTIKPPPQVTTEDLSNLTKASSAGLMERITASVKTVEGIDGITEGETLVVSNFQIGEEEQPSLARAKSQDVKGDASTLENRRIELCDALTKSCASGELRKVLSETAAEYAGEHGEHTSTTCPPTGPTANVETPETARVEELRSKMKELFEGAAAGGLLETTLGHIAEQRSEAASSKSTAPSGTANAAAPAPARLTSVPVPLDVLRDDMRRMLEHAVQSGALTNALTTLGVGQAKESAGDSGKLGEALAEVDTSRAGHGEDTVGGDAAGAQSVDSKSESVEDAIDAIKRRVRENLEAALDSGQLAAAIGLLGPAAGGRGGGAPGRPPDAAALPEADHDIEVVRQKMRGLLEKGLENGMLERALLDAGEGETESSGTTTEVQACNLSQDTRAQLVALHEAIGGMQKDNASLHSQVESLARQMEALKRENSVLVDRLGARSPTPGAAAG